MVLIFFRYHLQDLIVLGIFQRIRYRLRVHRHTKHHLKHVRCLWALQILILLLQHLNIQSYPTLHRITSQNPKIKLLLLTNLVLLTCKNQTWYTIHHTELLIPRLTIILVHINLLHHYWLQCLVHIFHILPNHPQWLYLLLLRFLARPAVR